MSPHDVQQIQADTEPEVDLESQAACAETDGVPTHPTALNRVLQQIRVPPKMKRGTSLHSRRGSRGPKGEVPRSTGNLARRWQPSCSPADPGLRPLPTLPSSSVVMEIACAAAAAAACLPGDEVSVERVSFC